MADIPILPTEENKETLQDYINLQRQLESVLIKQSKLYDEIGHISKDLEASAQSRLSAAREHMDANKKDLSNLQVQYKNVKNALTDTDKSAARAVIESLKETMNIRQHEYMLTMELHNLELEMAKKKYDEETKWGNFATKVGKDLFGINFKSFEIAQKYGEQLEKHPFGLRKSAYYWGAILMMIKGAFDLFNQFDKSAASFRIKMGMTRNEAAGLRKNAESIAIEFMHVGVTIDGAYKSIFALREQMGSAYVISKGLIKDVAIMASQLGVSEENSAGFLRNIASVSGSSMETQTNMMYTAAYMSQAAGVPLDKVMGDISNRSTQTLTMMSRMPNQVLRTAIEARRLNTSINEMAKGSRSLLDFQESVNAEMDASVLLGRSINLQRARELAYRRDLEGSTKEILRITKSIDFENLDVFQQEAFARATGRSVDELFRMVQAEREWNKAKRSSDPQVRAMVANYEKMRKASEKTVINEAEKLKLVVQQKANQDRLASISQKWQSILAKTTYFLFPFIDATLSIVENLMEAGVVAAGLFQYFKQIGGTVANIVSHVWNLGRSFGKIFGFFGFFGKVWEIMSKIGSFFGSIFKFLVPMGSMLGKFAGFLGFIFKWVPVIGWVITAIQFVVNLFKRLSGIGEEFNKGFWHGMWAGMKAIGGALYDTLVQPFIDAWKWIKGIFVGNSPSKLALGILKGVLSIGTMLFDAITSPWRKALAWIMDKIPGMGKVAEKLKGGMGSIINNNDIQKKVSSAYVPAVTVTPNGTIFEQGNQSPTRQSTSNTSQESSDKTLNDILNAINQLNSNLEAGKIGFYVDGQLLSATIARTSEFRGGYGVNKI